MGVIDEHIAGFGASALQAFGGKAPWELTRDSIKVVGMLFKQLGEDYSVAADVAVHRSATIEDGAIIKGPAIIGPACFVAAGAYVRGGCWLESNCILGPGAELKSSFIFEGTRLAHFNFVGDSILGRKVNLEAGSIIANHRNEHSSDMISFMHQGMHIETHVDKFGALVGDAVKIGANAVIAPGAFIAPGTVIDRLSLLDRGRG